MYVHIHIYFIYIYIHTYIQIIYTHDAGSRFTDLGETRGGRAQRQLQTEKQKNMYL